MLSLVMAIFAFVVLTSLRSSFSEIGLKIDQEAVSTKNWIKFSLLSIAMIALVFFMFSNMEIGKNIVYGISASAIIYFIILMFKCLSC